MIIADKIERRFLGRKTYSTREPEKKDDVDLSFPASIEEYEEYYKREEEERLKKYENYDYEKISEYEKDIQDAIGLDHGIAITDLYSNKKDIAIPATIGGEDVTAIFAVMGTPARCISLPATCVFINEGTFSWCHELKSITVDERNENYSAQDGVLYNKDKTQLLIYPKGKTDEIFTPPDTLTEICDFSFYGCKSLKTINLSGCKKLASIKSGCVRASEREWDIGFPSLENIMLPADCAAIDIDRNAFGGCPKLSDESKAALLKVADSL